MDIVVTNLTGIILNVLVTDIMLSVDNVLVDLGFINLVIFMALLGVELTSPEFRVCHNLPSERVFRPTFPMTVMDNGVLSH